MKVEWRAVVAIVAIAGCGANRSQDTRKPKDDSVPFKAAHDAKGFVLYEGLPHQLYEWKELEQEKGKREHVDLHNFSFYKPALDVTSDDSRALATVLGDPKSFEKWGGEKKCGGFHPDFLAEYRDGDAVIHFLTCLGCAEAKVYSQDSETRYDLAENARATLDGVLSKYRKNWPNIERRPGNRR